jgi:hypothetical protein
VSCASAYRVKGNVSVRGDGREGAWKGRGGKETAGRRSARPIHCALVITPFAQWTQHLHNWRQSMSSPWRCILTARGRETHWHPRTCVGYNPGRRDAHAPRAARHPTAVREHGRDGCSSAVTESAVSVTLASRRADTLRVLAANRRASRNTIVVVDHRRRKFS